jgi:hypothetical protein
LKKESFEKSAGKSDGFFYGYIIVITSFFLQALGLGMFNSFGVFVTPLVLSVSLPH